MSKKITGTADKDIKKNKKSTNIFLEKELNDNKENDIKKDDIKNKNKNKKENIKMIDLCAGTGAFSYAFESSKMVDVIYANDIDESSKLMYDLNFDNELTLGNICDINIKDIPKHDILTAGFPCQAFSIAGKQLGFKDKRSNVFWKILDIVKHHKPECIILENVKNLISHNKGDTFKTIISNLEKEKYNIVYKILNTSEITKIPQHRERIYIVCFKDKNIFDKFKFDFSTVKKKKISEMLENNIDKKYYYDDEDSKIHKMIIDSVKNSDTVYQFRRVYVRENKNNECPTLTANMGTGGHNVPIILDDKGPRKLIPKECFNFQGFPDDYKLPKICDGKLYKLAGNAVSVPVVKLLANNIIPLLYNKKNNIV